MTKTLAQYIFAEETLYKTSAVGYRLSAEQVAISTNQIEKEPIPNQQSAISNPQSKISNQQSEIQNPKSAIPKTATNSSILIPNPSILTILVTELSEEDKIFLTKILAAVGINFEDVDLIELKKVPTLNKQEWIGQKKTNYFISFGVGLAKLGWQVLLPPYQQKTMDGVQFLLTDDLKNIASNVLLKKKLWEVLQKMFPKK